MIKRTRTGIFFLLTVLLLAGAFVVWNYGQKVKRNNADQAKPEQKEAAFEYLTGQAVFGPMLSADGQAVWYFEKSSGDLYRLSLSNKNNAQKYTLPPHAKINFVSWPKSGSNFFAGLADGKYIFDADASEFRRVPEEAKFIEWMPFGSELVYVGENERGAFLAITDSLFEQKQVVTRLPHAGFKVVPSPNNSAFVVYSDNDQPHLVLKSIGALEKISEINGLQKVRFSPDGGLIAFSYNEANTLKLFVLRISDNRALLSNPILISGDFTWAPEGQTIIYSKAEGGLYALNVKLGQMDKAAVSAEADQLAVSEIFSDRQQKYYYFIEEASGRLGRVISKSSQNK